MYYNGEGVERDHTQAIQWYRRAAEQGNIRAQYNLGVMHAKGEGVPQDHTEAVKWYRLAAEQGDDFAEVRLAHIYEKGEGGVPQDYAEALKWYQRDAERSNDAAAQFNVGRIYGRLAGEQGPALHILASRWYQLAANQGYASVQFHLGLMYDNGEGVPQDYVLAHMWLNLAAARGYEGAKENRDLVASHVTPDQLAEAQRLARDWQPVAER
jgi:TPR repeat protein